MFHQQGRQVGVRIPENQSTEQAPTQTLVNFDEMRTYAVRYGDERGVAKVAIVAKIGDVWYMPPNAETWSAALRPISPWLHQQLSEKFALANLSNEVPPTEVDVMGAPAKKTSGPLDPSIALLRGAK